MKAALVVAHGSRKQQSNDVFDLILDGVRNSLNDQSVIVEGAFISFREMSIESQLLKLIEAGATEITIIPYLLFAGNHVIKSIPQKVQSFLNDYPNVTVTYKQPLGADSRLIDIVVEKIMEESE